MDRFLSRSPMFDEAREKKPGHHWIVELLIFCLVFLVASTVQGFVFAPAYLVWFFTDTPVLAEMQEAVQLLAETGDFAAYMSAIQEATSVATGAMPDWLMIVELFSTALMTVTAILFCRWIEKRRAPSLGLRRGHIMREYGVGLLVGASMISAAVGIAVLSGSLRIERNEFSALSLLPWFLYLFGYVLQGMSEEVLCRGYLMVSISRRYPLWVGAVLSSLVFALLHGGNPGVTPFALLNLFLSGLVFAVYVIKRGNLWGACALHTIWNFLQGNVYGVNVSGMGSTCSPLSAIPVAGSSLMNGGAFGIEGGLADLIVELAALAVLLFLVPSVGKKED